MSGSADPPRPWRRRAQVRRSVRRAVLSRRRPLAALCAALAVVGLVHALRPSPPRTLAVTVARHDLASGTVLADDDLTERRFPVADVPDGLAGHVVGRTLAAPLRAGEPLTDVRLVSPALTAAYPGRVALPVRIADADAVGLLRVGDRVDLLAADPHGGRASYAALDLPVVALPAPSATGTSGTVLPGRLVVVAALPEDVSAVVGAAATDLLSVVLTR